MMFRRKNNAFLSPLQQHQTGHDGTGDRWDLGVGTVGVVLDGVGRLGGLGLGGGLGLQGGGLLGLGGGWAWLGGGDCAWAVGDG